MPVYSFKMKDDQFANITGAEDSVLNTIKNRLVNAGHQIKAYNWRLMN